jgi:hypothetical protein
LSYTGNRGRRERERERARRDENEIEAKAHSSWNLENRVFIFSSLGLIIMTRDLCCSPAFSRN